MVFFGSSNGYVYALDADTGHEQWRFLSRNLVGTHSSLPAWCADTFNSQVASKLVFSADETQLYFGSYDFSLYAVDIFTGVQHWVFPTGGYVRLLLSSLLETSIQVLVPFAAPAPDIK